MLNIEFSRVVIKVGSQKVIDDETRKELGEIVRELKKLNVDVAIVSSGAIACGLGTDEKRPSELHQLQAIASLGQVELMRRWIEALSGIPIAQLLLTHEDIGNRGRFLNARQTLRTLFARDAVPIINENDSISFDEIQLGDNDRLAAQVAALVEADLLVVLSSTNGLLDKNNNVVANIHDIEKQAAPLVRVDKTSLGTGGMTTKLQAATIATSQGIPMLLVGSPKQIRSFLIEKTATGTIFHPTDGISARKHWLTFSAKPVGSISVDAGAVKAIVDKGKSVLPSGIVGASGRFSRGDLVSITTSSGEIIGQGITAYACDSVLAIIGLQTSQIRETLGYDHGSEVIHRDDLVLLP